MGARFERRMNDQAAAYCQMTPDQKAAYLDQQIAEMQKRQQQWEAPGPPIRPKTAATRPVAATPKAAMAAADRAGRADRAAARTASISKPAIKCADQRLDSSTPQQRAQRTVYMQDLRQQCLQQGVSPPRMGGRF